jgi:phosphatidylserine/phosphatidylglycerophosphate/cardiolipin synthase-like enzyme
MTGIEADFLEDGGQSAADVADRLVGFIAEATSTIDIAIYDFDARAGATARVADALEASLARGVRIRVAFNREQESETTHNPPMASDPEAIDGLEVPTKGVHDQGALMHHKYLVRDGVHVWTGSTNWTDDAFSREENTIVLVSSPEVAFSYTQNFEQLWAKGRLESSGGEGTSATLGRGVEVRAVFSPRGPSLAHRIAERIAAADRRVRILSPVITSGAVLGTLAEIAGRASFDLVGAYDATQMREVVGQWNDWPPNKWKIAAWDAIRPRLSGKTSTPWSAAGGTHDYMHAKVVVADGDVLTGSYNLSHGGEDNAENVLHIRSGAIAQRFGAFVERVAARYATPADAAPTDATTIPVA